MDGCLFFAVLNYMLPNECRRPESNRHGRLVPQDFKSCASACSATAAHNFLQKWMEMDSNHRSESQQIYSLPPLATREPIHMVFLKSS